MKSKTDFKKIFYYFIFFQFWVQNTPPVDFEWPLPTLPTVLYPLTSCFFFPCLDFINNFLWLHPIFVLCIISLEQIEKSGLPEKTSKLNQQPWIISQSVSKRCWTGAECYSCSTTLLPKKTVELLTYFVNVLNKKMLDKYHTSKYKSVCLVIICS